MITNEEIESILFKQLKASQLDSAITGYICKKKRRHNSIAEDAVIVVIANEYAQMQVAEVSLNVYVTDINVDGQYECDNNRVAFLKKVSAKCIKELRQRNMRFILESQNTLEAPNLGEHIISNRIRINILNED